MMEDKKFFSPGDIVMLNKSLSNQPLRMMIIGKEVDSCGMLLGFRCLFFDYTGAPHECVFNTKDLILEDIEYAK